MKKNYLYTNGCSWTAGGGLETYGVSYKFYKQRGMSWNTHRDINWPKKLSQKLNLQLIDESESGGGMERVIRMTFDYILSDLDRAKQTLFIIEVPTAENRIDLYSTEYKNYLICNCGWIGDGKTIKLNDNQFHSAVITYEKDTFEERISEKIKPVVIYWCNRYPESRDILFGNSYNPPEHEVFKTYKKLPEMQEVVRKLSEEENNVELFFILSSTSSSSSGIPFPYQ